MDDNLVQLMEGIGISIDPKNLHNPTNEFIIYIIKEIFKAFYIDGNQISQISDAQNECLSYPSALEDALIAVNLSTALSSFCTRIFIKEFTLTDITCPGPKRTSKMLKMLINFYMYLKNTLTERDFFQELDYMESQINENKSAIQENLVMIGEIKNEIEKKQHYKKNLQNSMIEMKENIKTNEKISKKFKQNVHEVQKFRDAAFAKRENLRHQVFELQRIAKKLRSQIVESPEELKGNLLKQKKKLEDKKEERGFINESITRKKLQKQKNEEASKRVDEWYNYVKEELKIPEELRNTILSVQSTEKKISTLKTEINSIKKGDKCNINKIKKESDHLFAQLEQIQTKKFKEKQSSQCKLEGKQRKLHENKHRLENNTKIVSEFKTEISSIILEFEKLFKIELAQEKEIQEAIFSKHIHQ